jgi:hypothetical protein
VRNVAGGLSLNHDLPNQPPYHALQHFFLQVGNHLIYCSVVQPCLEWQYPGNMGQHFHGLLNIWM